MLGKLLKYELKSTMRTFLPLYAAILGMSFIIGMFGIYDMAEIGSFAIIIFISLMVALTVVTVLMIINRFNRNLLKDEGYLMFTLPVKVESLVLSKVISSIIYIILSTIVVMIAFVIIMLLSGVLPLLNDGLRNLWSYLTAQLMNSKDIVMNFVFYFVDIMFGYIVFILTIYFSISLGQLRIFRNKRTIAAVIGFMVINSARTSLTFFIINLLGGNAETFSMNMWTEPVGMVSIGMSVVVSLILFFGTVYILKNKLNLE